MVKHGKLQKQPQHFKLGQLEEPKDTKSRGLDSRADQNQVKPNQLGAMQLEQLC